MRRPEHEILLNDIRFSFLNKHSSQIRECFTFLQREIDKNHDDISLLFQNPLIIENWLKLVKMMRDNEVWYSSKRTMYNGRKVFNLDFHITRIMVISKYEHLYWAYHTKLRRVLAYYRESVEGGNSLSNAIDAIIVNRNWLDLDSAIREFKSDLDEKSIMARSLTHYVLTELQTILRAITDRGMDIAMSHSPTYGELTEAFYKDLKEWSRAYGQKTLREMREDLNRHYKARRTDPYTPELWGEMLNSEEEALIMASKDELLECDDLKQEHWGIDMKAKMTENGELMSRLYSLCSTDELFDFAKAERENSFVGLLTPDNLPLFFDIILRRNIILREINPELKAQHDKWLLSSEEETSEGGEKTELSKARQSKLDEIINTLKNGNWKQPATAENMELMLNTVFGRDTSLLDDAYVPQCEKMWALVEGGSGDRLLIVPANLAGFFSEENLLAGSPTEISNDLFGNGSHVNNINKGHSSRCSKAFGEIIPFLRKYVDKMIRQG